MESVMLITGAGQPPSPLATQDGFFLHVVFYPEFLGILMLLGVWSSSWGDVALLHRRFFMPESPDYLNPPHFGTA